MTGEGVDVDDLSDGEFVGVHEFKIQEIVLGFKG